MDKTRNKIFVGCLALLLVMVAGYALFSQNITINGTAKAQGDFSLVTTCQPGIPDNLKNIENFYIENGYYDDSCIVNGNNINYKASFKWPGARRYFTIKVKNTGSIDAIPNFNYSLDNFTGKFCFDQNFNGEFELDECSEDRDYVELGFLYTNAYIDFSFPFAFEDKNGKIENTDYFRANLSEEEMAKFFTEAGDFIIRPGYSAYYEAQFGLNEYLNSERQSFLLKFDLNTKVTYSQPTVK